LSISSLNFTHTCERNGENKQKQNYQTKDICEVSNVLKVYQPAQAGQFATMMAKKATNVSMKNGQSQLAVKAQTHDKIECHIGQYLWIPSLLSAYKESDPDGSFAMDYTDCDWNSTLKQFYRCYVCLSIEKELWTHAKIGLINANGTHTRSLFFKHIVLIATTYDANNQIVILAFACHRGGGKCQQLGLV
jgi:hypothetical protein